MKEYEIEVGMEVKIKSKTVPGFMGVVREPFCDKIQRISTYGYRLARHSFKPEEINKKLFVINGNYYRYEDFSFSKQLMLFEDEL